MGGIHHLEHGAELSLGEVLQHPRIHQTHPEDLLHNTCAKYIPVHMYIQRQRC